MRRKREKSIHALIGAIGEAEAALQEDALAFFQKHREAMLKGTRVLWEEKNSYCDLMVQRLTDGESSFNSELQNEPINPDDCLFMPEWLDFYNEAEVDFRDSYAGKAPCHRVSVRSRRGH